MHINYNMTRREPYDTVRLILTVFMSASMAVLFFGMAIKLYDSDTPSHIASGLNREGYGLEVLFVYIMGKCTRYPLLQVAFSVAETIAVMLTWVLSQKFIDKYFILNRWSNLFISTGMIFLAVIYIPKVFPFFYSSTLGSQMWHSSTQFGMRLVGLASLYAFFDIYPSCLKEGISLSKWAIVAILLAVTTMIKPNFLMPFCMALSMVSLMELLKDRNRITLKRIIRLESVILPSLFVLGVQYILIYASGSSSGGIELVFFSDLVWNGNGSYMVFKFISALAFPLLIWVGTVRLKEFNDQPKSIRMNFLMMLYFSAIIIFSLFKETGYRSFHGNFGWGVPMSYFLLFLYIASWFLESMTAFMIEQKSGQCTVDFKTAIKYIYFSSGIIMMTYQFLCGLVYYVTLLAGVTYWH